MQLSTVVSRRREPRFSRVDDELLAIDTAAGCCHALSGAAPRVWELLASPITVDALCRRLLEEFDVEQERCRAEVIALLGCLDAAGLLETRSEAA